ncbi:hyaluronidase isoform X1 [Ahaetulla prasina]|uniref:hyaluronidase isoform X1 n=2 Tax=Ahaetulla prasina TaxID=499056 RepID=UPI002649AC57|nr:hyaluronidase isoform X1 [Ahaetulla prasina]
MERPRFLKELKVSEKLHIMCHLWIKCLATWILLKRFNGVHVMQTKAPMYPNEPFLVFWNAPTTQCQLRYKVDLDLKTFHIVPNANESLSGSSVTIFYPTQLGVYPHIDDHGHFLHGIIPQNESLTKHLNKTKSDITRMIPLKTFHGLGVIDWENWRPQWDRNWGSKNVYRTRSIQFSRELHPDLSEAAIKRLAKQEYEKAGKSFMRDTLLLAEDMRPGGYWGYYLYPDCYNYDYKKKPEQYTGKCPNIEISRNDQLLWLWRESTALFPSIYLEIILKSSANALKFVHHRLEESMRIASMARKDYALPVFVYARPFYAYTFEPLTEEDLVATIGETAAMGAAGMVFWGSMQYASTIEACQRVKDYMNSAFGRYIINVTSAAKICSHVLCNKKGRCVRKHSDSNAYLHLFPESFRIMVHANATERKVIVKGKLELENFRYLRDKFKCQCYQGWKGLYCEEHSIREGD